MVRKWKPTIFCLQETDSNRQSKYKLKVNANNPLKNSEMAIDLDFWFKKVVRECCTQSLTKSAFVTSKCGI